MVDFLYAIQSFTKDIDSEYKRWTAYGQTPSPMEFAAKVEMWLRDMDKFSNFKESNSAKFYSTHTHLKDAWGERDNTIKGIRHVEHAIAELKAIEEEPDEPKIASTEARQSAKSLVGDENLHRLFDHPLADEIVGIRRQVDGFVNCPDPGNIGMKDMMAIKTAIEDVVSRFEPHEPQFNMSSRIHQTFMSAVAARKNNHRPVAIKHYLNQTLEQIDAFDEIMSRQHIGGAGNFEATSEERASVLENIERVQSQLMGFAFYSPERTVRENMPVVKSVARALGKVDDPKGLRLAREICGIFEEMEQVAGQRRIKALGDSAWAVQEMNDLLNVATQRLDSLSNHIRHAQ